MLARNRATGVQVGPKKKKKENFCFGLRDDGDAAECKTATDGGLRLSSAATASSKKRIKRRRNKKTKSSAKQNF